MRLRHFSKDWTQQIHIIRIIKNATLPIVLCFDISVSAEAMWLLKKSTNDNILVRKDKGNVSAFYCMTLDDATSHS